MLGRRKYKSGSQAVSFDKIEDFKITVELTGEIISVLQNLMVLAVENKAVNDLVETTNQEAVIHTFSLISNSTRRMLATQGVDTTDKLQKLGDII